MGYFPFFIELSGKDGLIAGGGRVALQKLQKLLPYGPRLTVAAPEIIPEISALREIRLVRRGFSEDLLEDRFFVVAATDDHALNHRISVLCQGRGIPVNVADSKDDCSFLFPALVSRGGLSIGISTGGASPSAALYLKEQIQRLLPEGTEELLLWLERQRELLRSAPLDEGQRARLNAALLRESLKRGEPLSQEEVRALLSQPETADIGGDTNG